MLFIGRIPANRSRRCSQYGDGAMVTFSISVVVKRGFSLGSWMSMFGSGNALLFDDLTFIFQDGGRRLAPVRAATSRATPITLALRAMLGVMAISKTTSPM